MLSDSVAVETKHFADTEGFTIELERDSEYVCKKDKVKLLGDSGTAIILDLKSVLEVFGQEEIKTYLENTFLRQCGLLTEWFRIELGIFPVISVESGRYIEYIEIWWGSANEKVNELYWHGINLDRGRIAPGIRIVGADCGKCVVNISDKEICPNVARDNLAIEVKEKITLAIEKAAHQYIADRLVDDKELQTAVQRFIDRNYPCDNPYYLMDSVYSEPESEEHCK